MQCRTIEQGRTRSLCRHPQVVEASPSNCQKVSMLAFSRALGQIEKVRCLLCIVSRTIPYCMHNIAPYRHPGINYISSATDSRRWAEDYHEERKPTVIVDGVGRL